MFKKLLIANRGEIAVRIARSAAELGLHTVSIHSADDAASLHTRRTDERRGLEAHGPAAYLDIARIVALAKEAGCDAIHPGYGFLSENAAFARACAASGIAFVGPAPETLDLFGDKARARALAESVGVPVLPGTAGPTTREEAKGFLEALGPGGAIMIKAIAGGGGRGMRPVARLDDLDEAYDRCRDEAEKAFGRGEVYVERFFPRARHIEIQVIGDGRDVTHLWERECSLQRQRQKLIEIAPAPGLAPVLRDKLIAAALALAKAAHYRNIGTFEFLVDAADRKPDAPFAFIEANPRLQVEHTVSEEVTGVDLVRTQLRLAAGAKLADLGLSPGKVPPVRGVALQARVNMERMEADGSVRPTGGVISAYDLPSGAGIRVDGFGYTGYRTNANYDSLLAKLIVHAPSDRMEDAVAKAYRALCETRIGGIGTNIGFLQNVLRHPALVANRVHTRFIEEHLADLVGADPALHAKLYVETAAEPRLAGAKVDSLDPLAVLAHGKAGGGDAAAQPLHPAFADAPLGTVPLPAPMQGTIVSLSVQPGNKVRRGQT
ncbi:MAG: carbamoyl-phosphate synthase large subunit, partial [Alphaproteobacteria bacterium]|nr:carbamoyl-phosphate synthase large subunit [Alphaproteobacteria bacterium]